MLSFKLIGAILFLVVIAVIVLGCLCLNKKSLESFLDYPKDFQQKKWRIKGGWDQGFYENKISFQKVKPINTKCELLQRFYGGNHIIQFNEYLEIVQQIFDTISENRNLDTYEFGPMKTSELCTFHVDEKKIKEFLTKKLNEIKYDKILYDHSCENFFVQEPKLHLCKCAKTGAILIHYYFTLYHPKRETSTNCVARILIDEDKKIEIVDAKSAVQFSGEYNGYEKHTSKNVSPFTKSVNIPIGLCSHRHLDKYL